MQLTAVSGDIYQNRWRDDVLGSGGVFIAFTNPRAANATASIGTLGHTWRADSGMFSLSVPLQIQGNGDIHVQVDPLVGPGAGTSVGLVGSTSFNLSATAGFKKVTTEGGEGLYLVPDIPCQSLPLTIRTNGQLKIGPLSTDVPSIGANFFTTLGKRTLEPITLVDSVPRRFKLIPERRISRRSHCWHRTR